MSSILRDALMNKARAASGSDKLSIPGKGRWTRSTGSSTAVSFRSMGHTIASALSASGKQKKRRRAPLSKLGCPEFCVRDPPPATILEGVDLLPAAGHPDFTTGHAKSLTDRHGKPWLSVVLWSHASSTASNASYCDGEDVQGEVRLHLDRAECFSDISVWFVACVHVRGTPGAVICQLHAPLLPEDGKKFFTRQKLRGTYVWPFMFPLPPDAPVFSELAEANTGKGHARVRLPPSFLHKVPGFGADISYTVHVDTGRDRLTIPFRFLPRTRPAPQLTLPFPFLPTTDDWPFTREVIQKWSITPFGGRGRFGDDTVEVEGLTGIQDPAAFAPGDVITFKLLLISSNFTFLDAMACPSSIKVELSRAVILGEGALNSNYDLQDRHVESLATGMIWKEGQTPEMVARHQCQATVVNDEADPLDMDGGVVSETDVNIRSNSPEQPKVARSPSPSPSLHADDEKYGRGRLVRFDGKVEIPSMKMKPSFRYATVAVEHLVVITFSPPDYTHISPRGHFQIEFPIWMCSDRSRSRYRATQQRAPGQTIVGAVVDIDGAGVSSSGTVMGVLPARERRVK